VVPYRAVPITVPAWFSASDGVKRVPEGSVAVVYPYLSRFDTRAMTYQAFANYWYKQPGIYGFTPGPDGDGRFDVPTNTSYVESRLNAGVTIRPSFAVVPQLLAEWRAWGVQTIIVPSKLRPSIRQFCINSRYTKVASPPTTTSSRSTHGTDDHLRASNAGAPSGITPTQARLVTDARSRHSFGRRARGAAAGRRWRSPPTPDRANDTRALARRLAGATLNRDRSARSQTRLLFVGLSDKTREDLSGMRSGDGFVRGRDKSLDQLRFLAGAERNRFDSSPPSC
jgi:hypothetical protein